MKCEGTHVGAPPLNCGVRRHGTVIAGGMTTLRSIVALILWLLPTFTLAQGRPEFVGTWVIDVEKMAQVDPVWGPPPAYEDRFIITGLRSDRFFIQGSAIWLPGAFDPSGEATKIAL